MYILQPALHTVASYLLHYIIKYYIILLTSEWLLSTYLQTYSTFLCSRKKQWHCKTGKTEIKCSNNIKEPLTDFQTLLRFLQFLICGLDQPDGTKGEEEGVVDHHWTLNVRERQNYKRSVELLELDTALWPKPAVYD